MFEQMWKSVGDRVTDLIFKMEQLDEDFVGSTWAETAAIHDRVRGRRRTSAESMQQTAPASQGDNKLEPIRNRGQRVGRNDPCPCGSGKKYKNCHMRIGGGATV